MALATAGLGLETSLLSRYESNFWLGARTKTRTTLDVMRIITFGQSIYLAIFLVVYGTQLFDADRERANGAQSQLAKCSSLPAALALAALALVSPCLTVVKMYRIIEDFTVVAHVDSFANRRIVQQVLRRGVHNVTGIIEWAKYARAVLAAFSGHSPSSESETGDEKTEIAPVRWGQVLRRQKTVAAFTNVLERTRFEKFPSEL